MNLTEWIASTFGSTALVSLLIFLGRNLIITKLKESVAHDYKKKLEDHKADLKAETNKNLLELQSKADVEFEKYKVRIGPYSEKQFERYNELWVDLADLRQVMDELWHSANTETLDKFSKKLRVLYRKLEKSALLIEGTHYEQLMKSLDVFVHYELGKQSLLFWEAKQADGADVVLSAQQINNLIQSNDEHRKTLNNAMEMLKIEMRSQLNGTR